MKWVGTICGLALALLMGLSAQPAWAQKQHGSAPPASHAPSMGAAGRRQSAPPRPNARPGQHPAPRPGGYRPAYNGHPPQAQGNARVNQDPNRPPQNAVRAPNAGASQAVNRKREGGMSGLSPGVRQNLRDMSPLEQDRFLQNNERFKSLPPQQQAQVRNNLRNWNRLSPTERNAMNDRARTWQRMSPQQRQYVQSSLLPKWQRMSPDRKQLVTGRLHTLQGMGPAERQAALQDPQFMRGLNPDEQSVLRGLDSLNGSPHP
jgi:uncharacterized protein DUF3106